MEHFKDSSFPSSLVTNEITQNLFSNKTVPINEMTSVSPVNNGGNTNSLQTDSQKNVNKSKKFDLQQKPEEMEGIVSSSNYWNTYANNFVNTQLVKCETDKTDGVLYDPLQINVSTIKEEPCEDIVSDERQFASNFVAVEMRAIKQSNSIPCDGYNGDDNFAIQAERKGIERGLQQTNEIETFLVMDIKAEIEELTWNPLQNYQDRTLCGEEIGPWADIGAKSELLTERRHYNNKNIKKKTIKRKKRQRNDIIGLKNHFTKRPEDFVQGKKMCLTRSKVNVNETEKHIKTEEGELVRNPLHDNLDSLSCDEEINISPEMLAKREWKADCARKAHEKRRNKLMKRKERLRIAVVHARSKKSEIQEDDLLEDDENYTFRLTRSKVKADETQDSGIAQSSFEVEGTEERFNKALKKTKTSHQQKQLLAYDIDSNSDDNLSEKRKLWAARMRERRARETPEETETRRLKARIAKMKSRLVAQLIISEDELKAENSRKAEEMRLMRQKRREAETPEETAARKLKQSLQARKSRNRLEAAETPEETAKRKAERAAYLKKRKEQLKAKQTPEEQAIRKEQRKQQRRLYNERKISEIDGATAGKDNIITVQAFTTQPEVVNNDLASSWNNNTPTEFNINSNFNND